MDRWEVRPYATIPCWQGLFRTFQLGTLQILPGQLAKFIQGHCISHQNCKRVSSRVSHKAKCTCISQLPVLQETGKCALWHECGDSAKQSLSPNHFWWLDINKEQQRNKILILLCGRTKQATQKFLEVMQDGNSVCILHWSSDLRRGRM